MKPARPGTSTQRRPWLLILGLLAVSPASLHGQLVRGQVVDSVTGAPVGRSTVILADPNGAEMDRTVSDAGGFYLLRAPRPGRYVLMVAAPGYRGNPFPPFTLAAGVVPSFRLEVAPLASGASDAERNELAASLCPEPARAGEPAIVGVVRDAETGEPVPGALVHLSIPDSSAGQPGNEIQVVETDGRGAYAACRSPRMSRVAVHAVAGDRMSGFEALLFGNGGVFHRGSYRPMDGTVWRLDLEVEPPERRGAALAGAVRDTAGAPVSGATVEIVGTPYQTRSDGDGRFRFLNLTHGDVRVRAKQVGYAPAEFDLELPAGDSVWIPEGMLTLGNFPVRLRDIIVTGEAAEFYHPRLDGFFLRRETSPRGKFATREDWQKWMHFNGLSDVLPRMRFGLERIGTCLQPSSAFVDGVYVPPGLPLGAFVDFDQIVAIEAYGNGMDAPRQYRRHRCGSVILLWTSR